MSEKNNNVSMQEMIRINKYLSEAGVCSRRDADLLVAACRVTVNDRPASQGQRVSDTDIVCVDGKRILRNDQDILLLFYKPVGIVCSTKKQFGETTVTEYLDYPERIYPVGRLDKDSEGLLLMTNQGDLLNKILRAGNYHEKEYLVSVDRPIDDAFLEGMGKGVPILDTVTRPCTVTRTGRKSFRIILTQGMNRQIRRMCAYFGYEVVTLKRVRIMNLTIGGLRPGEFRQIKKTEYAELLRMLEHSSGNAVRWKKS